MWRPEIIEGRLPSIEATYRVRLANALREEAQVVAAAQELERAARLFGPNGELKVEALREKLPRVDDIPLLTFCRSSSKNYGASRAYSAAVRLLQNFGDA